MKPLELSESFRSSVSKHPRDVRGKIGQSLRQLEEDLGHPHRHQGLSIRKLTGNFYEIRVGLDIPLIFQNLPESLLFVTAATTTRLEDFLREFDF